MKYVVAILIILDLVDIVEPYLLEKTDDLGLLVEDRKIDSIEFQGRVYFLNNIFGEYWVMIVDFMEQLIIVFGD